MRQETLEFVKECLKSTVEDMNRVRTPEEIREAEKLMVRIHYEGAVALERLETSGGVKINYCR